MFVVVCVSSREMTRVSPSCDAAASTRFKQPHNARKELEFIARQQCVVE